LPLDEVRRVVQDDKAIYPLDNADEKRKFLDLIIKLDLITLSADPQGKLEGFLISYRTWFGKDLDRHRPEQVGDTVSVDVAWVRPDLRTTGETLRQLIREAFLKNRLAYAGATKIVFNRQKDGGKSRWHDYIKFSQRFL